MTAPDVFGALALAFAIGGIAGYLARCWAETLERRP